MKGFLPQGGIGWDGRVLFNFHIHFCVRSIQCVMDHYLKCRKNTESKNAKITTTKNGRIILLSKCALCDSKKSKYIKQQEASGFLSSLGIKAPWLKFAVLKIRICQTSNYQKNFTSQIL